MTRAVPFPGLSTVVSLGGRDEEEAMVELERFLVQRIADGAPIRELEFLPAIQASNGSYGCLLGTDASAAHTIQLDRLRRLVDDLRFGSVSERSDDIRHALPCQAWTLGQCYQI